MEPGRSPGKSYVDGLWAVGALCREASNLACVAPIVARQSAYWLLQLGSQSDTFTANGAALRFREFETVGNTPKGITSFVVNKSQS
jgi:hypothetical protein